MSMLLGGGTEDMFVESLMCAAENFLVLVASYFHSGGDGFMCHLLSSGRTRGGIVICGLEKRAPLIPVYEACIFEPEWPLLYWALASIGFV